MILNLPNALALGLFLVLWLFYEQILRRVSHRVGAIVTDMTVIRNRWMAQMTRRPDNRLVDSNLLSQTVHSASYFASANLLLIAAVSGALFNSDWAMQRLHALGGDVSSRRLLDLKLALIVVCLARGFLDFTWSIRQLNYVVAVIGAGPLNMPEDKATAYAQATARVINPALSAFSEGVRAYYFSLAAAGWLFGAGYLVIGVIASFLLLAWRQSRSRAAQGLREIRQMLELYDSQRVDK